MGGCASSMAIAPNLGKNKAKITLNPREFRVVKTVIGEASSPYLFWIDLPSSIQSQFAYSSVEAKPTPLVSFELGNRNLHQLAMKDLLSKHDLRGKPQILHNILEEWTLANYLGLFAILRVKISAEVIEFIGKDKL